MKSLFHPYIIRLYEVNRFSLHLHWRILFVFQVMESKNLIYLVTEYAANGELLGRLIELIIEMIIVTLFHLRSTPSSETIK